MKAYFFVLFCFGVVATLIVPEVKGLDRRLLFNPTVVLCSDKLSNCAAYDPSVCSSADYKPWATDNCAKTCNLCTAPKSGSGNVDTNGGGTDNGTSSGCVYDSKVYQQGESWNVGCKYKCHCMDSFSGQYTCNELCIRWNMPPQCHIQPPMRGKCCPSPYCPEGFIINYPPGYIDE